ncbi:MAG: 16S rRNA (adenine(1518)-N(6)/adenine(1519)-N(6))-dimethyltransferase RsmA [Verrucomicrobiota bacterium]|nr:16S rRNA (adenine(1518)-N(6)/adenine(1519)-N(6))-dimethyltransferase RsmA [Verrucomicrobiota bacterium]
MNLTELRAALAEAQVTPVKSLGQNFLHDENLARWIVTQADVQPDDCVVEIGPGLGALTREIAARGARVLALEKDARLAEFLRREFVNTRVEVRHIDAMRFDARELFAHARVKILGNLPYYVASQLLLHYVDFPSHIILALFMLQDEMARRLAATQRDHEYGAFSLRLQSHFEIEYLRKIPNSVFFPRPEVDSAMIRLAPRDEKQIGIHDVSLFRELVRSGFSQRRKQLRNGLSKQITDWEPVTAALGIARESRAEDLSREQWIALANFLSEARAEHDQRATEEQFPVVDEEDRVIGSAARSKVHEDNLRHRAVHLLLFNEKGEVLLQKRSGRKDRHPYVWDSSAAGHVDAGEEYDFAATRELIEELGVRVPLQRIGKLLASPKTGEEFIWIYTGQHEGPFPFNTEEISAVMFFPVDIVERWIAHAPRDFAPGFLECWHVWARSTSSRAALDSATSSSAI